MQELEFFDSNCMLGRSREDMGVSFDNVDELKSHMERYFISSSLVYHSVAKHYNQLEGNDLLLEETKGQNNLYNAIVVLPHHTGEALEPTALRKYINTNKISAVRLCPKLHDFVIHPWATNQLFTLLDNMHVPVFLDYDVEHWSDPLPWNDIYEICSTYPNIPFVMTRLGCAANRTLFPLMDKCKNLHFEISYYAAHRGLENVAEKYGVGRMLFGTAAPIYAPSCPISMLYYSALSFEDKQRIASGNLKALIGGINYGK